MSRSGNRYHAERWVKTVEEDLRAAEVLAKMEMYALACFHDQQAGEKAVKSLWYLIDADPWGQSVKRLLQDFPRKSEIPHLEDWIDKAALLDTYYIPTRYPNGLPDLTPSEIYIKNHADRGIKAARRFVAGCKKWMQKH